MDRATRKLMTKSLRGRVAMLQTACAAHAKDFRRQTPTRDRKPSIAQQWETALKEWQSLRFTLEQLQKTKRADQGQVVSLSTGAESSKPCPPPRPARARSDSLKSARRSPSA